jgi:hypothetical protein
LPKPEPKKVVEKIIREQIKEKLIEEEERPPPIRTPEPSDKAKTIVYLAVGISAFLAILGTLSILYRKYSPNPYTNLNTLQTST